MEEIKKSEDQTEKDSFHLEAALSQIEEIIQKMESPDVSLAESLTLYKEGVELTARCKDAICDVEKEIEILETGDEG